MYFYRLKTIKLKNKTANQIAVYTIMKKISSKTIYYFKHYSKNTKTMLNYSYKTNKTKKLTK